MPRPKLVPIALLMILTLVAVACGGGSDGTPGISAAVSPTGTAATSPDATDGEGSPDATDGEGSPDATDGGTADISGAIQTLGINYAEGADEIGTTRVDMFRERYPDVELEITEGGFDPQVFLSAVAGGAVPDVVRMPRNQMGTYVAQGALQPIGDCDIDMSVYRQPAVDQLTYQGQVYGVPEFFNTRVLIINNAVLEEAGLTADDIDTSDWEGLAEVNQQTTQNEGGDLTRLGFDPKLPEFLPLWARINGAQLISDDGLTSNLEDPAVAEALGFTRDLIEAQAPGPDFFTARGAVSVDFFGAENPIATGALAAFPIEQWYVDVLARNSPEVDITVKGLTTRDGEPITFSDGDMLAIPTGADNVEAACEFLRVMTSADAWAAAAQARVDLRAVDDLPNTGTYTGNIEADERIYEGGIWQPTGIEAFDEAVEVIREGQEHAFALPATPAAEQFDQEWRTAVDNVLSSGQDPAEALQAADEAAQSAIDSAASSGG